MAIDKNTRTKAPMIATPKGNVPLQITRWTGSRASVTTSGTTQRLTLPTGAEVVEITAQEDVYLSFGDSAVDASSTIDNAASGDNGNRIFLKGVQIVPVPYDADGVLATHIAVIQVATAGVFQVEEVQ